MKGGFDFVFLLLARDSSSKLGSPLAPSSVSYMLFLLIFLHVLELVMDSLNVHVHGLVVVIGKGELYLQSFIRWDSDFHGVLLLVMLDVHRGTIIG